MFNFQPRKNIGKQTAGRDLSSLLRLQSQGLGDALDEVKNYGTRTRGADIVDQIAKMTPEEKKNADFMAMGGKNTQSQQTMDMLKSLTGQQEKDESRDFRAGESQKDRDFRLSENSKNRAANATLAKLRGDAKKEEQIPEESKAAINKALIQNDTQMNLLRGQLGTAKPRDKAHILARIQELYRAKTKMEKLVNPDYAKGVETQAVKTAIPGDFQMGKLFPVEEKYKKK